MFTKNKDFLYCLGVATLFLFAIYFAYAVLKGSGEGIQKILGNTVEGMSNKKNEEKITENLEEFKGVVKKMKDGLDEMKGKMIPENLDEIKSTMREACQIYVDWSTDYLITTTMQGLKKGKNFNDLLKTIKMKGRGTPEEIYEIKKFMKLLDGDDDSSGDSSSGSAW